MVLIVNPQVKVVLTVAGDFQFVLLRETVAPQVAAIDSLESYLIWSLGFVSQGCSFHLLTGTTNNFPAAETARLTCRRHYMTIFECIYLLLHLLKCR